MPAEKLYYIEHKTRTTEDRTPYDVLRLIPSANPLKALQQALDDGVTSVEEIHKIVRTGAPLEANPSKNRDARIQAAQRLYDERAAYLKAKNLTDADVLKILKRRPA